MILVIKDSELAHAWKGLMRCVKHSCISFQALFKRHKQRDRVQATLVNILEEKYTEIQ